MDSGLLKDDIYRRQSRHICRRIRPFGKACLLLAALVLAFPATGQRTIQQNNPGVFSPRFGEMERRVHSLVNSHRREKHRLGLSWREAIASQCRLHSRNMARGMVAPGHEGVEERIAVIRKSLPVIRYSENVAVTRGYADPALDAFQGWLDSPGHRKNIEGEFDMTGVGVAVGPDSTFYITQIFIRSR